MKAHVRLTHVVVEVEESTQKALFTSIANAYEVFGEACCGLCGAKNIRPVVRNVVKERKSYEYFEWKCGNGECRATLSIGQMQDGGKLFPKRKLTADGKPDGEHGTFGRHRGWTKFRGGEAE